MSRVLTQSKPPKRQENQRRPQDPPPLAEKEDDCAEQVAPRCSSRLAYWSHDLLCNRAVGDARAAVDELLDLLSDPDTDDVVRATIQDWLNRDGNGEDERASNC